MIRENLHLASITPEFGYGKLSRKPFANENADVAQVEEAKGIVGYTGQCGRWNFAETTHEIYSGQHAVTN